MAETSTPPTTFPTPNGVNLGAIADALSQMVGPGKRFTQGFIAELTGQEERTVKAHRLGESIPTVGALFGYFRVLPVAFADQVLAQAGLCGVRRLYGDANAARAMTEMAEGLAILVAAQADGRIDHRERPGVVKELREALVEIQALLAELERLG